MDRSLIDSHWHQDPAHPSWCRWGETVCIGAHPWYLDSFDEAAMVKMLAADPALGVGEIGLDRIREKHISDRMRAVFARQLVIAAYFRRPVVLHGARCWGEVVEAVKPFRGQIPAFLFHGFSRSEGLIPAIVDLGGFISVGAQILNDHAENYRALVKAVPHERLLVETDWEEKEQGAGRKEQVRRELLERIAAKLEEVLNG